MNKSMKKAVFFLISQAITLFGSTIVQFAMIWYVTLQTSSGVWVSIMTAAGCLPQFIISFFSGVWADRYPKKRMIILADGTIAIATLALVLLMPYLGEGTPLLIALVVISTIRSLGAGIQTPAVNAVIPEIVDTEKLMKFNGTNATVQSIVQFIAPAAAAAVLNVGPLWMTLMIDIITAVIGIGILSAIALPHIHKNETPSMWKEMKEGIVYAKKETAIGSVLAIFGLFIFLCVPAGFMCSLFVGRYYGNTYWYMTLVEVVGFIGMMAGGILIGTWGGFKNRITSLAAGVLAFGALAIGMGAIDNFIIYLVLMVIYGVAITMVQIASTTILQEKADPKMQGRVFGLFGAVYTGFMPLGSFVFGPLSDVFSLRLLMIISGILLIIMAVGIFCNKKLQKAAYTDPSAVKKEAETQDGLPIEGREESCIHCD